MRVSRGEGASVWTSADGITWSRVPHGDAVFGNGEMCSVTVGGPGLVAVSEANQDAAVQFLVVFGPLDITDMTLEAGTCGSVAHGPL